MQGSSIPIICCAVTQLYQFSIHVITISIPYHYASNECSLLQMCKTLPVSQRQGCLWEWAMPNAKTINKTQLPITVEQITYENKNPKITTKSNLTPSLAKHEKNTACKINGTHVLSVLKSQKSSSKQSVLNLNLLTWWLVCLEQLCCIQNNK